MIRTLYSMLIAFALMAIPVCPSSFAQQTTPLWTLPHASQHVPGVAFSPNDQFLLTGCYDQKARLWSMSSGDLAQTFSGHTGLVYDVAFFPDATRILTASSDYTAKIWDASTSALIHTLAGHGEEVLCCDVSPDGSLVATGGGRADKSVIIWNPDTGTQVTRLYGHGTQSTNYIVDLLFSSDGEYLATSGYSDNTVLIRRTSDWQVVQTLGGYLVDLSPDASHVLTLDTINSQLKVYSLTTGTLLKTYTHPLGLTVPIKFSADGSQILCGYDEPNRKLCLLDAATGNILSLFATGPFNQARFSSDKKLLVTGDPTGMVKVWSNDQYWVPVELSSFQLE